ncbi:phage holin [Enterococcus sp. BWB1-3]|uniref:phage holin n=1 Tax=unclassified Enterococcus TaxID=2608891 RepID=UPI0019235EED|nr:MULTISPECIES: phage holin [unclassified Enterococcus]MBL1227954.1 phage holin [Enterococcus sp. BWB1-3]MCB5951811.1 phage holin [Enterococcus sp. BWT-B8]MCB5954001.1 phage holin [Enterococcus sp. CWB-B31]
MKQVTKDTIARTVVLVLALFNQILAITGKGALDIIEDDVYQIVSLLFTIGSTTAAWWKNNSFTKPAIEADGLLKELKKDGES